MNADVDHDSRPTGQSKAEVAAPEVAGLPAVVTADVSRVGAALAGNDTAVSTLSRTPQEQLHPKEGWDEDGAGWAPQMRLHLLDVADEGAEMSWQECRVLFGIVSGGVLLVAEAGRDGVVAAPGVRQAAVETRAEAETCGECAA